MLYKKGLSAAFRPVTKSPNCISENAKRTHRHQFEFSGLVTVNLPYLEHRQGRERELKWFIWGKNWDSEGNFLFQLWLSAAVVRPGATMRCLGDRKRGGAEEGGNNDHLLNKGFMKL